jgi:hypothetical protein
MSARQEQTVNRQGSPLGVLARLWWMLLGNAVLALSFVFIFRYEGDFLFHLADVVLWITVATLVLVRYVDVRFLGGQTATGQSASTADWIRYAVVLIAGSTVLWGIAHATNYLFVERVAQG